MLKHLRSSTANKRPQPSGMAVGQIALNTASGSPGVFFVDSANRLVKVGPVHIGSGAPNASPASGGASGNTVGEQWLDNSGGTFVMKTWDGTAWRSEAGEFVNASGDTMTGSLTMGVGTVINFEGSVDDGFETTLTVTNPTADRTITLPNITGTVITTGDTGSITGTMIADNTIVNAEINASAAIAGTKISPDFGGQNIVTSGNATAASLIPTGSVVPANGLYLPSANEIGIATGSAERVRVDSSGRMLIGTSLSKQIPAWPGNYTLQYEASKQQAGITVAQTASALLNWGSTSNAGSTLTFGKSRSNTVGTYGVTALVDGSNLGNLIFSGDDSTKFVAGAAISAYVDGTPGADNMPGRLVFNTTASGAASPTERMRIGSTGAIAIGSTITAGGNSGCALRIGNALTGSASPQLVLATPQIQLDATTLAVVYGVTSSTAAAVFNVTDVRYFNAGTMTIGAGSSITNLTAFNVTSAFSGGTNTYGFNSAMNAGTGKWAFYGQGTADSYFAGNNFIWAPGGSEQARIDSSGRLLLGTSSATEAGGFLTISTETDFAPIFLSNHGDGTDRGVHIFASRARTSKASPSLVSNGDRLLNLIGRGYDGTAFRSSAGIRMEVDGTAAASGMPGRIAFSTAASGAINLTEQLRITSDGVLAYRQDAPITRSVSATLTIADLKTGILTSSPASGVVLTLPSGGAVEGGFSGIYTNMAFEWSLINLSATNTVTFASGIGHTVVGSGTIAANLSARFATRRTATNTFVSYRLS